MRGLTILAFILISAQSLCCAQDARSVQSGNEKVELIIENQSDLPLKIQWIDFEGKPQDYGVIPAGQAKPFESYPGYVAIPDIAIEIAFMNGLSEDGHESK